MRERNRRWIRIAAGLLTMVTALTLLGSCARSSDETTGAGTTVAPQDGPVCQALRAAPSAVKLPYFLLLAGIGDSGDVGSMQPRAREIADQARPAAEQLRQAAASSTDPALTAALRSTADQLTKYADQLQAYADDKGGKKFFPIAPATAPDGSMPWRDQALVVAGYARSTCAITLP